MRTIPKFFDLMGHTIEVVIRNDLIESAECYGRWLPGKQRIELQAVGEHVTKSLQMQTFWHEVVHAILDNIGHEDLSYDEPFVDRMGQALHQVLKTKRNA